MALTKVSRGLLSTGIVDNSNATAITIDSDENVTIGSVGSGTASATPVELNLGSTFANSAGSLSKAKFKLFEDSSANVYGLSVSSGLMEFGVPSSAGYAFFINESEKMRLTSTGLGIGTSSPNSLAHIYGGSSGRTWTPDGADKLALEHSDSVAFDIRTPSSSQGLVLFSDADARARGIVGYAHASDYMYFNTAGLERLRLDSSGTLLVGKTADDNSVGFKTNTSSTYMVASGGTPTFINRLSDNGDLLEFRKDSSTKGRIGTDGTDIFIGSDDTNLLFHTDGVLPANSVGGVRDAAIALGSSSARFVDLRLSGIMYSGSARIGTTVQQGTVTIDNEAVNTCLTVHQTSTSVNYAPLNIENEFVTGGNTGTMAFFKRADGTIVGSITSTITATAYATGSDQRLKDNIVDAPSASNDIDAIQVRSFDWKADGSHQKYGMVAQELQGVAPEAVIGNADSDDMMMVDYSKLVPMLVKEIQSLRSRVAQLET